jgi:hypothetical protein
MTIPATIVTDAIESLEQRLDEFNRLNPRHRRFKNRDVFHVRVLLDYAQNATENERQIVTELLDKEKNNE